MPTEAEFLSAAAAFDHQATVVEGLAGPLLSGSGPEVLTGGVLTAEVMAMTTTSSADGAADAAELRALADTCRDRASVVAAAAAADAAYRRRMGNYHWQLSQWRAASRRAELDGEVFDQRPPWRPSAPPAPPSWVEF